MSEAKAFQVHESDNVATLLEDVAGGRVMVYGCARGLIVDAVNSIALGHKVALESIAGGAPVIKYGVPIGVAAKAIRAGEWVHLHNCQSAVDERSNHLNVETGAAQDTPYV
jgi:hypothetical protein